MKMLENMHYASQQLQKENLQQLHKTPLTSKFENTERKKRSTFKFNHMYVFYPAYTGRSATWKVPLHDLNWNPTIANTCFRSDLPM